MAAGIISLITLIAGFIIWLIKRKADKSPAAIVKEQSAKDANEINKILSSNDSRKSINDFFNNKLQDIHSDSGGQRDSSDGKR